MSSRLFRLALFAVLVAVVVEAFRRRSRPPAQGPGPVPTPWEPLESSTESPEPSGVPAAVADAGPRQPEPWIRPDDDGGCPPSHPIKAKQSSKIVHRPGGLSYERTRADRCYLDLSAAEADGYRPAKR